jgi:hypothetical protein
VLSDRRAAARSAEASPDRRCGSTIAAATVHRLVVPQWGGQPAEVDDVVDDVDEPEESDDDFDDEPDELSDELDVLSEELDELVEPDPSLPELLDDELPASPELLVPEDEPLRLSVR